jgi:hypothetical protein
VGARFVVYAAAHGQLELVGLDATSGHIAWTVPASPSAIAPGTAPTVAVVGNRVVYLEAAGGALATIVAADATTGKPAWHGPSGAFSGWPRVCPDNPTALCASGQLLTGSTAGALRFDAATGGVLASPQVGQGARELGVNLFDIGQRQPEIIAATAGSTAAWQQPLHRIFTLRGSSTDYGWNFDRIPRVGMYVGSVGGPPLKQSKTRYAVDLSRAMTAGFRMRDGSVVWRDPGSQYLCGYLTCPGAGNQSYSSAADAHAAGPTVGLRLRARGVLSGSANTIEATPSRDAHGILEGFDPATGHESWRFDFGRDVGLLSQTRLPPRVSTQAIVLRTPAGQLVVLNVITGARIPAIGNALAWCNKIVSYHMAVPYVAGGRSLHEYVGQYALAPCTPDGHPMKAPTHGTAAVSGLLAKARGELAWMEQGAVVAVPA